VPEALSGLDHFLRDHRTGDVHHFDPQIFDLLADLTAATGQPDAEIHIICGYRSPWGNEFSASAARASRRTAFICKPKQLTSGYLQ
jgi:uncharacterized protein YcbK (DUF882 family)